MWVDIRRDLRKGLGGNVKERPVINQTAEAVINEAR